MPASASTAASRLLNRLDTRSVRRNGDGWKARCPAHDDKEPSLSIHEKDGKVLIRCFAGCTTDAIMAAVGLTMAALFSDATPAVAAEPLPFRRKGGGERLAAVYQYGDGAGNVVAEKGRFELPDGKKTFRWRPAGTADWSGLDGLSMSSLALWGAELVAAAPADQWLFFCEGEKATLACREHGLLALTHAGGASTKEFGDSLEVLRGRKVALWPDNDGAGRDYMATVHARIRGIAAAVRVVTVPLPPKGDAVEFFQAGGTVAELEKAAPLITGPSVEYLGTDHIAITMPVGIGTVAFDFDEMEKSPRSLDAALTIVVNLPGLDRSPYNERINIMSRTARDDLRKDLEAVYGKEMQWTKLLNTVFGLARERYVKLDRSVDVFDVTPTNERELFFHHPLLAKNAITIMFGDRGSVKSYIVSTIAFCTAIGTDFLGQTMPHGPVLFIDYEDNQENFRRRIDRIAAGMELPLLPGMIHYVNLMGLPFADAAATIRKKVVDEGILLVILDSVAPAMGGKPEDAIAAIVLMQALRKLGVTVLCLAHVPKNHGEQPRDPFGSVFFSNLARRTWYVERVQEEASDLVDVGLYCKKVNDGPLPHPIALSVTFAGLNGPVKIQQERMASVPRLQEQRGLGDRLWDVLERGRLATIKQLAEDLGVKEKEVEHALNRDRRRFVVAGEMSGASGRRPNLWGRLSLNA